MAALETTKRKFHQLLENLTSGVTTSTSSFVPNAKRRRVQPRSRLQQSAQSLSRYSASNPPPYYVPWSHELFLARLKTFADVHLWSSKPSKVSEVEWAKRGWTCVGYNTVACKGGCEQRVVLSLRPELKDEDGNDIPGSEDYNEEISEALVERFAELIEQGHEGECLWRGKACGEEIYRMPIARKAIWLPQLRERYRSFAMVAQHLPKEGRLIHSLDVEAMKRLLPNTVFEDAPGTDRYPGDSVRAEDQVALALPNDTALALASMGWMASTEGESTVVATCHACFRRLGLWLYTSDESTPTTPQQQREIIKLDLEHNHRDYCPWINGTSQMMPGALSGVSGWQFLQKAIRDNAEFTRGHGASALASQRVSNASASAMQDHDTSSSSDSADVLSIKSRDQVEKEDNARFARLRELTQSMGLKGLRMKLGKK